MSEEEDEVIKLKGNVVTRTNEQRLTRNVLRLDLLIFRRFQFWRSFLSEQEGENKFEAGPSSACSRSNTSRRSAISKDQN